MKKQNSQMTDFNNESTRIKIKIQFRERALKRLELTKNYLLVQLSEVEIEILKINNELLELRK